MEGGSLETGAPRTADRFSCAEPSAARGGPQTVLGSDSRARSGDCLCLPQIKWEHIGDVARREWGGKEYACPLNGARDRRILFQG
jgi:hypothetical protein